MDSGAGEHNVEEPQRSIDYGDIYPLADTTVLLIGAQLTGGGWRADPPVFRAVCCRPEHLFKLKCRSPVLPDLGLEASFST